MPARVATTEAPRAACRVATHAAMEADFSGIARLRDLPGPEFVAPLPPRFMRHCDEQTVVGMRAVLAAMEAQPDPRPSYADFGVVAAACRPGRVATAASLSLYATGGAATVSPHIVPQCSLHSLAGAVSVALGMHGPHLGVGGGPRCVSEGIFAALSLLAASSVGPRPLPGLWLVLTSWTEEPRLDAAGRPAARAAACGPVSEPVCHAVAAALVPDTPATAAAGPALTIRMPNDAVARHQPPASHTASAEIRGFAAALAAAGGAARRGVQTTVAWSHRCPWEAEIDLAAGDPAASTGNRGLRLREAA